MIRTSETVAALFAALAGAQAEMAPAVKDTKGVVGNAVRSYADLASVREAARAPLGSHDLAFVQFPASAPAGSVRIITRVVHKSGEWIEDDEGLVMPAGQGSQAVGSAMTYARRYALMAALGIVADDDDDGHAANTPAPPVWQSAGVTEAQLKRLHATFNDHGIILRDDRLAFVSNVIGRTIESSKDLTKAEAGQVIEALGEAR